MTPRAPALGGPNAGSTLESNQALASLFNASPTRGPTVLANAAPAEAPLPTPPLPLLPVPGLAFSSALREETDPIAHVRSDELVEALLTLDELESPGESEAVPPGPEELRAVEGAVLSWPQASDAWFATEVRRAAALSLEGLAPVVTTEQLGSGQDALTLLTASALVVSGVWGPPPQQRERRRGQRA
jgi:hypothetical protein